MLPSHTRLLYFDAGSTSIRLIKVLPLNSAITSRLLPFFVRVDLDRLLQPQVKKLEKSYSIYTSLVRAR
eukprot:scaffold49349_cov36-Attheya_sp.AAC.2